MLKSYGNTMLLGSYRKLVRVYAFIPDSFTINPENGKDLVSHPFYNLFSSNISERFEIEYEGNDIKKVTIFR